MALSVTPTSGAGPYTFTIDLYDGQLIDGVRFGLEARTVNAAGRCEIPDGANNVPVANALLDTGIYVRSSEVSEGNCFTLKVDVVDLATSEVISTKTANIDNV